ncbi:MAG: MBL fold metallo-hydrolase [Thermaerobacter sp.]|jgi:flavorubredoxin|nr:MBL fold metallo-hydrolase [Thermaerobacter sp.]
MVSLEELAGGQPDLSQAVLLFEAGRHRVYWVGSEEATHFRCNAYLLCHGDANVLIDPGGRFHYDQVSRRVEGVVDPQKITHIVVQHQDPDLCGSLPLWLERQGGIKVLTNSRAAVLLPHYGLTCPIEETDDGWLPLGDGAKLRFLPAPFMHFPGAFVTYDPISKFLFSGDIFAAVNADWQMFVQDFDLHSGFMEIFHTDYMAGHRALAGFTAMLRREQVPIRAILPQHGSIIMERDVPKALEWLGNLLCGLDLIYPADEPRSTPSQRRSPPAVPVADRALGKRPMNTAALVLGLLLILTVGAAVEGWIPTLAR